METFSITFGDSKFFSPDVLKLSGISIVRSFSKVPLVRGGNSFHVDNAFYLQRRCISTASSVVNVRCKTNGIFSFVREDDATDTLDTFRRSPAQFTRAFAVILLCIRDGRPLFPAITTGSVLFNYICPDQRAFCRCLPPPPPPIDESIPVE